MKRGPTQKTMNRWIAERPAAELVTDWIPCTTPPVRDGVYEAEITSHAGGPLKPFRMEFKNGTWTDNGMNRYPEAWKWRGVRRWVLRGPDDNILSRIAGAPVHIYLHAARPRSKQWGGLTQARPFKTEAAAQRFADRYQQLKLTAVMP